MTDSDFQSEDANVRVELFATGFGELRPPVCQKSSCGDIFASLFRNIIYDFQIDIKWLLIKCLQSS